MKRLPQPVRDYLYRLWPRGKYDWINVAAILAGTFTVWGPAIHYDWSMWVAIPTALLAGLVASLIADAVYIYVLYRRALRKARALDTHEEKP